MTLVLRHCNKHYGKKHALKDFTFSFETGVYGLLGPNGAGKSTLMNLITDNLKPDKDGGEILWDGQPIRKLGKSYRACLGFMPQQQELYANMTARDFLGYLSALKGIPRKEAKDQIADVLEQVELSEQAAQKIGGFSGGMKQRVVIAMALANSPQLLIADEPTSALDVTIQAQILELLEQLKEEMGLSILFISHDMRVVYQLCDRVMIMKDGTIVESGDVDTVYFSPQHEYTKELLEAAGIGEDEA